MLFRLVSEVAIFLTQSSNSYSTRIAYAKLGCCRVHLQLATVRCWQEQTQSPDNLLMLLVVSLSILLKLFLLFFFRLCFLVFSCRCFSFSSCCGCCFFSCCCHCCCCFCCCCCCCCLFGFLSYFIHSLPEVSSPLQPPFFFLRFPHELKENLIRVSALFGEIKGCRVNIKTVSFRNAPTLLLPPFSFIYDCSVNEKT